MAHQAQDAMTVDDIEMAEVGGAGGGAEGAASSAAGGSSGRPGDGTPLMYEEPPRPAWAIPCFKGTVEEYHRFEESKMNMKKKLEREVWREYPQEPPPDGSEHPGWPVR